MSVGRYLVRRSFEGVLVVFLASIVIFLIIRLIPGDPAQQLAGEDATPEDVEVIRDQLGLNDPILTQYGNWIGGVVQLDFGKSFTKRVPVRDLIAQSFPPTFELAVAAYVFALVVGIPLGVAAAVWAKQLPDYGASVFNLFTLGIPNFVLGILLLWIFSVELDLFPVSGRVSVFEDFAEGMHRLVLPMIAAGSAIAAVLARFVRTSVAEALAQDYVRTAHAKGLRARKVILDHALRNAMIPIVTIAALQIGNLLAGAIVVEIVFTRPGFGFLIIDGIGGRDYLLIQAMLAILVFLFVAANTLADITYGYLDPRIRVSGLAS